MNKLERKINNYLIRNTNLIDKFSLLRLKFLFKKIVTKLTHEQPCENLEKVIEELNFIIQEQYNDRDNVLEICEYIDILKRKNKYEELSEIEKYLNIYIDALTKGLSVNELYVEEVNKTFENSQEKELYPLTFEDVLDERAKISSTKLVLTYSRRR